MFLKYECLKTDTEEAAGLATAYSVGFGLKVQS